MSTLHCKVNTGRRSLVKQESGRKHSVGKGMEILLLKPGSCRRNHDAAQVSAL
jgi:hypothetical protein